MAIKIGLIVNTTTELKYQNFLILSNATLNIKCQPILILADSLSLIGNNIVAACYKVTTPLEIGKSIDNVAFEVYPINDLDYIWVLAFGRRQNFLDTIQFLWLLERYGKGIFINSVESLMYFNNKYILNFLPNFIKTPKTYAANNADYLYNIVCQSSQNTWILKPPAESMGRNVFILKKGDTNIKALIQMLTSNITKRYCLLQEYIADIGKKGEKRVLIAKGEIICHYTRMPQKEDHRTNLHQGAKSIVSSLTQAEKEYCIAIAQYFKKIGLNYIGLDMVFPYILEINIVNPGGLNTVQTLSGKNYSAAVVKTLFSPKMSIT
jgi:glutathione synthase